jgi:hypothetical protein
MGNALKHSILRSVLIVAMGFPGWCTNGHATGLFSFGDVEKPNPTFTPSGDRIVAKFIPRAKSTSVTVEFQVTEGGTLAAVKGIDFANVDRPEVDVKNFKSAAFEIDIRDVTRGGMATVAMRSDFFSLSTAFYVFNPKQAAPWIKDAQKANRALAQRVRELVVQVQDGGKMDADGAADGQITMIGGPRDSFWGYALGTLFIRFFGIFFVLSLLMIGMIASGLIFKRLDRRRESTPDLEPKPALRPATEACAASGQVPEVIAAAIAAAIYLRDDASPAGNAAVPSAQPGMAWTQAGRQRIMHDRLAVFRHAGGKPDGRSFH